MLKLERKIGETIVIGEDVSLSLLEINTSEDKIKIRLAIGRDDFLKNIMTYINKNDELVIGNGTKISFVRKSRKNVVFGIDAPRDIPVFRSEIVGGEND